MAFSDFQFGFRSFWSTADLCAVVLGKIACAFNRSGATRVVALDTSKAFDRIWHAGLLHKLKFYGFSGQIFGLFSFFLSNRWLWVVLDGKSLQEYLVNAGVPQGSIHSPILFLLCTDDFLMLSVMLLSMLMILLFIISVIRHLICGNSLNLLLNLNLIYKTLDWGKKWFVDVNAGKTQLLSFDWSKCTGSMDVKMEESVLEEK